jgi:hypothetical protein
LEGTEKAQPSATKSEHDERRREALKKLGKLAAAAPAALVLLQSRRSMAGHPHPSTTSMRTIRVTTTTTSN